MSNDRQYTPNGGGQDDRTGGREAGLSRRDFVKTSAAAGAGALALGGSSNAAAQSVVDTIQQGDMGSVPGSNSFMLYNNQWSNDGADQTVYTYDDGSFGWEFSGGDGEINYPEVFAGRRAWGTDTGIPELSDITLGEVEELTFSFDVDIDVEGNGHYNLAEEFWLLDGLPGDGTITHELMMLCDWGGGHQDAHSPFEEHEVWEDQFGNTIDFWDRTIGGTEDNFLIFGVSTPTTTGKIDLKPLIDYVLEDETNATEDHHMSAVELGTETFGGPTGEVHFEHFGVTINGSTYTCGPGEAPDPDPEPEPPSSPSNVWTNEVTETTVDLGWESVSDADHYNVYRDGSQVAEPTGTSHTLQGLSAGTTYTVGVEAENGGGPSPRETTDVTTAEATTPEPCADAAGGTAQVDGQTVCDVDGNGDYRDVTADGTVGQGDVAEFFSRQHRDAWKQPELFDFSGNGDVTHGDVVELADHVALN